MLKWLAAAGVVPSADKTYTRTAIEAALQAPRGVKAIIQCDSRHPTELREIWYHFVVRGSLQEGEFIASDPDFSGSGGARNSCPDSGIKYLPKRNRTDGPSPTTTNSVPTGTNEPSGKGHLIIKLKGGGQRGCLISNGRWYNTVIGSSCASFRARESSEAVTLQSSKGPCGVQDGEFSCGRYMPYTPFKIAGGQLVLAQSGVSWSANEIPRGTKQQTILASGDGDVAIELLWRTSR